MFGVSMNSLHMSLQVFFVVEVFATIITMEDFIIMSGFHMS
eukprot:13337.XXX_213026_213148_1 [CDS] Oithona nana genome sequencing.